MAQVRTTMVEGSGTCDDCGTPVGGYEVVDVSLEDQEVILCADCAGNLAGDLAEAANKAHGV